MKLTLFLDFDGVLHPENCVRGKDGITIKGYPGRALFDRLPMLVEALAPYPDIQIVLSTTWVRMLGFNKAKQRLGELAERVIGATYHSGMRDDGFDGWPTLDRGEQVKTYIIRNKVKHWVALDDDPHGWSDEMEKRLVWCPREGLNPEKIAELIEKIEKYGERNDTFFGR
jgi:hypothetical protein